MATDTHTNKLIAFSAAVLSATVAILTTALVITSNATQGSLNRVHNGVMAMDGKVADNTKAVGALDTKISVLIAQLGAAGQHVSFVSDPTKNYVNFKAEQGKKN